MPIPTLLAPAPSFNVVWIAARSAVQGAYSGHDGLRAFCADNAENFDLFQVNIDEVRDLGDDRVLGVGTIHIRGRNRVKNLHDESGQTHSRGTA